MKKSLLVFVLLILSLSINQVIAAEKNLIDETRTIQDHHIWYTTAELVANRVYTVDIEVTSGNSIDLIVLNALNYRKYEQAFLSGSSVEFEYYSTLSFLNITSKTYTITLEGDIELYFVIENVDFITGGASGGGDVDIHLVITYESDNGAAGFELFFVPTIAIAIVLYRRRKNL